MLISLSTLQKIGIHSDQFWQIFREILLFDKPYWALSMSRTLKSQNNSAKIAWKCNVLVDFQFHKELPRNILATILLNGLRLLVGRTMLYSIHIQGGYWKSYRFPCMLQSNIFKTCIWRHGRMTFCMCFTRVVYWYSIIRSFQGWAGVRYRAFFTLMFKSGSIQ